MKKVFTVGVFDLMHLGHIELFRRAKEKGDELIVAVQDSDYILKYKPEAKIMYSTAERMYMVYSIRFVDQVVVYKDVDSIIREIDFDIFVKGPDQNHSGFKLAEQWCIDHSKEVVTLSRTEGISSTMVRTIFRKSDEG